MTDTMKQDEGMKDAIDKYRDYRGGKVNQFWVLPGPVKDEAVVESERELQVGEDEVYVMRYQADSISIALKGKQVSAAKFSRRDVTPDEIVSVFTRITKGRGLQDISNWVDEVMV